MHATLQPVLVLLATAVLIVVVFRRLKQPPLLGYLIAGVAIGPHALGWVGKTQQVNELAEIGVVFLMFSIGLEFSLAKLKTMRRTALSLGSMQVALTLLVVMGVAVARRIMARWIDIRHRARLGLQRRRGAAHRPCTRRLR